MTALIADIGGTNTRAALCDETGYRSESIELRNREFSGPASLLHAALDALGDDVSEVRISHRLTDSPSCLVLGAHEMPVHMQQIMKWLLQQRW